MPAIQTFVTKVTIPREIGAAIMYALLMTDGHIRQQTQICSHAPAVIVSLLPGRLFAPVMKHAHTDTAQRLPIALLKHNIAVPKTIMAALQTAPAAAANVTAVPITPHTRKITSMLAQAAKNRGGQWAAAQAQKHHAISLPWVVLIHTWTPRVYMNLTAIVTGVKNQ